MAKRTMKLGHINFRLDPELHRKLLEIAQALGTDLSGLLKQLIKESLPAFSARAAEAVARQHTAVAAKLETVLGLLREPDPHSPWSVPHGWTETWQAQLKELREQKERMERGLDEDADRERPERDRER